MQSFNCLYAQHSNILLVLLELQKLEIKQFHSESTTIDNRQSTVGLCGRANLSNWRISRKFSRDNGSHFRDELNVVSREEG